VILGLNSQYTTNTLHTTITYRQKPNKKVHKAKKNFNAFTTHKMHEKHNQETDISKSQTT